MISKSLIFLIEPELVNLSYILINLEGPVSSHYY